MTEIQKIKCVAAVLHQSGMLLTASDPQVFTLAVRLIENGIQPR